MNRTQIQNYIASIQKDMLIDELQYLLTKKNRGNGDLYAARKLVEENPFLEKYVYSLTY